MGVLREVALGNITEKERLAIERGRKAMSKNLKEITSKDLQRMNGVLNVLNGLSGSLKSNVEE